MLTNFDLADSAEELHIPLRDIYFKDRLPLKPEPGAYIINLQDSGRGFGTHWVAVAIKGNRAYYFDSFGFDMPTDVIHFLRDYRPVEWSAVQIQDEDTGVCGSFVLAWLWWLFVKRGTTKGFQRLFSKDPDDNRRILRALMLPL